MAKDKQPHRSRFHKAKDDAQFAKQATTTPQTASAAYKLAFQDTDFLLREDLRPVRFQLELLKPELLLDEAKIESMLVIYGSARIPEPAEADALEAAATDDVQRNIARRLKAKAKYYDEARQLARLAIQQRDAIEGELFGADVQMRQTDFTVHYPGRLMAGGQCADLVRSAFSVWLIAAEGSGAAVDVTRQRVVRRRVIVLRVMVVVPQGRHHSVAQGRALFQLRVGRAVQGLKNLDGFE